MLSHESNQPPTNFNDSGDTSTMVAIGHPDERLIEEFRYPTTHPEETLALAI